MVHPQLGETDSMLSTPSPPFLIGIARTIVLSWGCFPKSNRFSGTISFGGRPLPAIAVLAFAVLAFAAAAAIAFSAGFAAGAGGGNCCSVSGEVLGGADGALL